MRFTNVSLSLRKILKPKSKRQFHQQLGHIAEAIVVLWLWVQGYRILERRFKNPLGEIDLIVKRGASLVFIEVKARKTLDQGLEALTLFQQRRIRNGARFYLMNNQKNPLQEIRFDYIVFVKGRLYHLKNAF